MIDAMLDRAKKEGTVDIYNYVRDIRSERMCMIQTVVRGDEFSCYEALVDGSRDAIGE